MTVFLAKSILVPQNSTVVPIGGPGLRVTFACLHRRSTASMSEQMPFGVGRSVEEEAIVNLHSRKKTSTFDLLMFSRWYDPHAFAVPQTSVRLHEW